MEAELQIRRHLHVLLQTRLGRASSQSFRRASFFAGSLRTQSVKMLELRPARECEVVLAFLRAEVDASRYGQAVMQWLLATRFTRDELLENADLSDVRQNQARATILGRYRGFPDRLLFAGYSRRRAGR